MQEIAGTKRFLAALVIVLVASGGLYLAEQRHANYELALMAARSAIGDQVARSSTWWGMICGWLGFTAAGLGAALPMNLATARGPLSGAQAITDPDTGFTTGPALRLTRTMELYQWVEKKRDGTANDRPQYSYSKKWRSAAAMSSLQFSDNRAMAEHMNPPTAVDAHGVGERTFEGRLASLRVNGKRVSRAVAGLIAGSCSHRAKALARGAERGRLALPFRVVAGGWAGQGFVQRDALRPASDGSVWQSHPPGEAPQVGDIRLHYSVSEPTHAAVVGGAGSDGSVDAWEAPNGETIRLATGWRQGRDRPVSLHDVLDSAHAQNTAFLLVSRAVAAAAMAGACALVCCAERGPRAAGNPRAPAGAPPAAPAADGENAGRAAGHGAARTEDPPAGVPPPEDEDPPATPLPETEGLDAGPTVRARAAASGARAEAVPLDKAEA